MHRLLCTSLALVKAAPVLTKLQFRALTLPPSSERMRSPSDGKRREGFSSTALRTHLEALEQTEPAPALPCASPLVTGAKAIKKEGEFPCETGNNKTLPLISLYCHGDKRRVQGGWLGKVTSSAAAPGMGLVSHCIGMGAGAGWGLCASRARHHPGGLCSRPAWLLAHTDPPQNTFTTGGDPVHEYACAARASPLNTIPQGWQ